MDIGFLIVGILIFGIVLYINKSFKSKSEDIIESSKADEIKRFDSVTLTFIGGLSISRGKGDVILYKDHIFINTDAGGYDMYVYTDSPPNTDLLPLKYNLHRHDRIDKSVVLKGKLKRLFSNTSTSIKISGIDQDALDDLYDLISDIINYGNNVYQQNT